jgi:hypothetical protein
MTKQQPSCFNCHKTPSFGGSQFCISCKIENGKEQLKSDALFDEWRACSGEGKYYFLAALIKFCNHIIFKKQKSNRTVSGVIVSIIGPGLVDMYAVELRKLLHFFDQETEYYGTFLATSDFTLVRFEQQFEKEKRVLDFWLSLCVVFDMNNYLEDIQELIKEPDLTYS